MRNNVDLPSLQIVIVKKAKYRNIININFHYSSNFQVHSYSFAAVSLNYQAYADLELEGNVISVSLLWIHILRSGDLERL